MRSLPEAPDVPGVKPSLTESREVPGAETGMAGAGACCYLPIRSEIVHYLFICLFIY